MDVERVDFVLGFTFLLWFSLMRFQKGVISHGEFPRLNSSFREKSTFCYIVYAASDPFLYPPFSLSLSHTHTHTHSHTHSHTHTLSLSTRSYKILVEILQHNVQLAQLEMTVRVFYLMHTLYSI